MLLRGWREVDGELVVFVSGRFAIGVDVVVQRVPVAGAGEGDAAGGAVSGAVYGGAGAGRLVEDGGDEAGGGDDD